jgi:hypothetical protein
MRGMTKVIQLGDHEITVRELAVWEVRNWIASLSGQEVDLVDELLIDGVQLSAVRLMAGISKEDMEQMMPSELDKIVDAAKQVNHRFFTMVDRVVAASRSIKPAPT